MAESCLLPGHDLNEFTRRWLGKDYIRSSREVNGAGIPAPFLNLVLGPRHTVDNHSYYRVMSGTVWI